MSDVDSSAIIATQQLLSKHIKKPPLTEKLLKKPPFRFLHDIITGIIKETGFLNGLYTANELDPDKIKDKESKIAFLDKLCFAVKLASGENLTARSAKIVAGLEVNKTLELLQAMGRALDRNVDTTSIVEKIVKKDVSKVQKTKEENKHQGKNESIQSKVDNNVDQKAKESKQETKSGINDDVKNKTTNSSTQPQTKYIINKNGESSDTVRRNGSNAKIQNKERSIQKSKEIVDTRKQAKEDKVIKTKDKRDRSLSKSRPIPDTATKVPGNRDQSIKSRSKDRKSNKVLNQNDSDNILLNSNKEQSAGLRTKITNKTRMKESNNVEKNSKLQPIALDVSSNTTDKYQETNSIQIEKKTEIQSAKQMNQIDNSGSNDGDESNSNKKIKNKGKQTSENNTRQDTAQKQREKSSRPTSARPGSRKQPRNDQLPSFTNLPPMITADSKHRETNEITKQLPPTTRPRTATRPPSARPGAPRVRDRGEVLVTDEEKKSPVSAVNVIEEGTTDLQLDDKDSAVVIDMAAPVESYPVDEVIRNNSGDQGHLVNQILTELKDSSIGTQHMKRSDIEWEAGRQRDREMVIKEVDKLRDSIQTLTGAANPLGKLIDYLQEDVDEMMREFEQWNKVNEDLKKKQKIELESSRVSLEPLRKHLEEVESNIQAEQQQLSSLKLVVLANDEKILKLATNINNSGTKVTVNRTVK